MTGLSDGILKLRKNSIKEDQLVKNMAYPLIALVYLQC